MSSLPALLLCLSPVAVDGDTIHCAGAKPALRVSGIDAPELPGHCRTGRVCAPGDPFKAKADMAALLASGKVQYRILKHDLYGRLVVVVYVEGKNASCTMIASGDAIFKPTWDARHIVKKECGL
jgi:endonuclease YncB( thermonuclease family)